MVGPISNATTVPPGNGLQNIIIESAFIKSFIKGELSLQLHEPLQGEPYTYEATAIRRVLAIHGSRSAITTTRILGETGSS